MLVSIQQNSVIETSPGQPLDLAIAVWLDAKSKRSGSAKTATAYRDTLADFRQALRSAGLDLTADPRQIALTAQAWAGASMVDGRDVAPGTFNQRLAIISSFYKHAKKQGIIEAVNPIDRIDRRTTQAYKSAAALPAADVGKRLKAIDRSGIVGKRDYALLSVALLTGRRVSELAALRQADLLITGDLITLTWRRTKGGKSASDQLNKSTSAALIEYLAAAIGINFMARAADAPIWTSESKRNPGKAVSGQTIADICLRRLGTSKVHALRHTFAHNMEKSGATASAIQARLGHESLATTGRYLAALKQAENPYIDALAEMMGIGS